MLFPAWGAFLEVQVQTTPKSGSVCRCEMGTLLAPSATDFRPQGGPPSTLHQAICRFSQAHFLEARLKWSSQDLKLCPGGMPDPQAAALLAVQGCLDLAWARVLGTPEMQRPPEVNMCMGARVGAPPGRVEQQAVSPFSEKLEIRSWRLPVGTET